MLKMQGICWCYIDVRESRCGKADDEDAKKKFCHIVPALLTILPWEITTHANPDSLMTKLKSS